MKTALVTGGTVRIGKAIADRLRSAGWKVLVSSHRPDAGADLVADLAAPGGPAALFAAAMKALGGIPPDALVNNASLFTGPDDAVRAVGYDAPVKLTIMMAGRETGRGAVVNILDAAVRGGDGAAAAPSAAYAAAKRALREYTAKSAAMFAATLRVNAVDPGPVAAPQGVRQKAPETPLGRPTPEAVADAVAFLLEAEYTTGATIPVDGGMNVA